MWCVSNCSVMSMPFVIDNHSAPPGCRSMKELTSYSLSWIRHKPSALSSIRFPSIQLWPQKRRINYQKQKTWFELPYVPFRCLQNFVSVCRILRGDRRNRVLNFLHSRAKSDWRKLLLPAAFCIPQRPRQRHLLVTAPIVVKKKIIAIEFNCRRQRLTRLRQLFKLICELDCESGETIGAKMFFNGKFGSLEPWGHFDICGFCKCRWLAQVVHWIIGLKIFELCQPLKNSGHRLVAAVLMHAA